MLLNPSSAARVVFHECAVLLSMPAEATPLFASASIITPEFHLAELICDRFDLESIFTSQPENDADTDEVVLLYDQLEPRNSNWKLG